MLSTVTMALNVVGVPLMVADTVETGTAPAEVDLLQEGRKIQMMATRRGRVTGDGNMTRWWRRIILERTDELKIGQVLQYFAMHFVRAERFVQEAVETVLLKVLVHILIDRGGKGNGRNVLIDAPDLFE